eukprot:356599-Chlamydomonas_euryale.AAC.4
MEGTSEEPQDPSRACARTCAQPRLSLSLGYHKGKVEVLTHVPFTAGGRSRSPSRRHATCSARKPPSGRRALGHGAGSSRVWAAAMPKVNHPGWCRRRARIALRCRGALLPQPRPRKAAAMAAVGGSSRSISTASFAIPSARAACRASRFANSSGAGDGVWRTGSRRT